MQYPLGSHLGYAKKKKVSVGVEKRGHALYTFDAVPRGFHLGYGWPCPTWAARSMSPSNPISALQGQS